jgi:hypothetical protein
VDQKYLESFEMWCWRRKKISWTDRVINEEESHRAKGKISIIYIIKGRKVNWIGHIWHRNCLLRHVTEGKVERRI